MSSRLPRGHRAIVHRQARHHEARDAMPPREQVDETMRHLRSIIRLVDLDDPAAVREVLEHLDECAAQITSLQVGRLMDQEA